jgi:hypothetical protein
VETEGTPPQGTPPYQPAGGGFPPPGGYQQPPGGQQPAGGYPQGGYPPQYPTARPYPLTFSVDYPDRKLNRLTSFFRCLWLIPILIIVGLLSWGGSRHGGDNWSWGTTAVLWFPLVLTLVFRQKYPRWWYDWNLNLSRFLARVWVYGALLRDEYPSTDEEQAVHLDFPYPDAKQLSRGLPLVKWFLAIPHWFILFVLSAVAAVCVVIAWFAILFTGRYPRGLFDFVVGVMRWWLRVEAYAILLITDEYPPFSFD